MDKNNFDQVAKGYIRVAAASPKIQVADPFYNAGEIIKIVKKAQENEVQLLTFPELSISGYTCGDLFFQNHLINSCEAALDMILKETENINMVVAAGMPVKVSDKIYNCGIVFYRGRILGAVPKIYIPNSKEFYEKRWFFSGRDVSCQEITIAGRKTEFGKLLFKVSCPEVIFGVEICEDLWAVAPPSSFMAVNGAKIIFNLSASNELVGKSVYRKNLVIMQSAKCICGYVYASAGVYESTTDTVFSGETLIAENGVMMAEGKRFSRESVFVSSDIDIARLSSDRVANTNFSDSLSNTGCNMDYKIIEPGMELDIPDYKLLLQRKISRTPFIPEDFNRVSENCSEIFNIQTAGLAKRLEHTKIKKVVIGISGGLDSTLALLVAHKTFELINLPLENIIGITMPGFGTTDHTYDNAVSLMQSLGITIKEINIAPACLMHFKDIGHDVEIRDTTYENTQARERTQILMDVANMENALVAGTGDLSELALGWCTYNGDHMSMYGVNSSIPKTLIIHMIEYIARTADQKTGVILDRILKTPISPELLPPDKDGQIEQKTENIIGPYILHDFFLYSFLRNSDSPAKTLFLAKKVFLHEFSEEKIEKAFNTFVSRFFSQQFKRSCMPDGPKVGSVSLSPRGDWRMPSDASCEIWKVVN